MTEGVDKNQRNEKRFTITKLSEHSPLISRSLNYEILLQQAIQNELRGELRSKILFFTTIYVHTQSIIPERMIFRTAEI